MCPGHRLVTLILSDIVVILLVLLSSHWLLSQGSVKAILEEAVKKNKVRGPSEAISTQAEIRVLEICCLFEYVIFTICKGAKKVKGSKN